jgi:hypothetical protein
MKFSKKSKAALKSYLRAVAASGITVALSIAGNMKPEYSVILGALVAPLIKALDPKDTDLGVNAE